MTKAIWLQGVKVRKRDPLLHDERADVCVVGAGFAGLLAALRLLEAGKSVIVLERDEPGAGESARTTAHLASYQDDGMVELERVHGEEGARLAAAGHAAGIDEIERICRAEKLDCDFRRVDGWLIAETEEEARELEKEAEACRRAGLIFERFPRGPRLRFPRQATLHAGRFLAGLADAVERRGGKIYGHSRVERIEGGERPSVRTARGAGVQAKAVVVATDAPIDERLALSSRQSAYRTYVVALRSKKGSVADALFWDMEEPYHYVRLARDGRGELLLVGGEDHRTGQADDYEERFERLERWARRRYPDAGRVVAKWSGQVQESADGIGFYGRHPTEAGNVYVATGDSGQGVTGAALGALIISDQILGRENSFQGLFSPGRVSPAALAEYVKENLKSVGRGYQRHFTPAEISSPSELEPGEGGLMRRGADLIAVYRGANGSITERSAVCPHLGGVVCWNALEKSWDCPAHGSRFSPDGEPLCGPTPKPLGEVEKPPREDRPDRRPRA